MNCAEIGTLAPLYLSGELDEARTAAMREHLQSCADCARDIEQQRELDARLRGALLAEEAGTNVLVPGIRRRIAVAEAKRRVLTLALTAAGVVLTAGLILYRSFGPPNVPRVFADAAQDHRREVVDRQVKKWRTAADDIEALARRQGLPVNALPALAAAGYRLDRARLCRLDGNVFMHLVYTDGAREMSVFLRPQKGDAVPLRAADLGPQHVVAVQSGGTSVLCVAEESRAALNLARSAAAAL
jgi:anti-sigma factor RsiW